MSSDAPPQVGVLAWEKLARDFRAGTEGYKPPAMDDRIAKLEADLAAAIQRIRALELRST